MNQRVTRLRAALEKHELDGALISNAQNRRYLSGFTGSAGYLLITPDDAVIATDFRYYEQSGLLPEPRRVSGRRMYDPEIVRTLAVIETAQRGGLTLDEIKTLVGKLGVDPAVRNDEWLADAVKILAKKHGANAFKEGPNLLTNAGLEDLERQPGGSRWSGECRRQSLRRFQKRATPHVKPERP